MYAFIEKMLPEPIREEQDSASLPDFTLHLVEQQVSAGGFIQGALEEILSSTQGIITFSLR